MVWHLLGNLFWGPWCAIGSHGDIHQLPSAPCYAGGQNRTVTWSWCPQSFKPGTKPIIRQAIVVILTHLIRGKNLFVKRKRLITVVLFNCVQGYFQMHAWGRPSSWAILIPRCQTLQLSRRGSGLPGYQSSRVMEAFLHFHPEETLIHKILQ